MSCKTIIECHFPECCLSSCCRGFVLFMLPHSAYPFHPGRGTWLTGPWEDLIWFNVGLIILRLISVINGCGISCEIALRWMSLDLTDDKSTLVQEMVWCCHVTSHYLNQCWPRSVSPYGATSQSSWVNHKFWSGISSGSGLLPVWCQALS